MYVVTEFGVVNLKGKSVADRAKALISIERPHYRKSPERKASEKRFIPKGDSQLHSVIAKKSAGERCPPGAYGDWPRSPARPRRPIYPIAFFMNSGRSALFQSGAALIRLALIRTSA